MYPQRKVDVNMLNAVKSVLADVSSVSPSSELRQPTHSLRRSAYPHQLYVDTFYAQNFFSSNAQGINKVNKYCLYPAVIVVTLHNLVNDT